ncbi:hypothetical protein FrCorBMG51_05325 [Protofrankia coriariae]|uniref:Uncharacterized protein n=1 Tax=Protofrankia coriariae TaxID=1562887 RepID=A0ABR5F6R6_9ACTN|nr:hypothetical protein FrCorBMG51_05325 [Protofrankia coriariae]
MRDTPGELAGYGPIPAATAHDLAADATWQRILTDPAAGHRPIEVSRRFPAPELARLLRTHTHPGTDLPVPRLP